MNFIQIENYIFPTILAISEKEHIQGLMFVKRQPPIVTFIYKDSVPHKMWMKNTFVPLDILFCFQGKIHTILRGTPHSENAIGPDCPTDIVIEMPAGLCKNFNIISGNNIKIQYDSESLARKFLK